VGREANAIGQWLRRYIEELEALVEATDEAHRAMPLAELSAARTIERAIVTGEYLLDLADTSKPH